MNELQLFALTPLIVLSASSVILMLLIAFSRRHGTVAYMTSGALIVAFFWLPAVYSDLPQQVTSLVVMDGYAVFFIGLILAAAFALVPISYPYLENRRGRPEEYYLLLLLASLGAAVVAASSHFAAFYIGLEILSVSLYAMIAYERGSPLRLEAGVKYLILAAVSSAFLLFGIALIYAEFGSMEFSGIASRAGTGGITALVGTAMVLAGVGFKLALVPFHMWTADVYEGAPPPVTAYIATVSKGAVFALLLRYVNQYDVLASPQVLLVLTAVAVASMVVGNLLALMQNNVKRILAYSSIAHIGYLLVALVAGGAFALTVVSYYLVAYFVTTIAAFGVIAVLSTSERDAALIDDYRGLAWRRPWLAGVFTAMLLSLAGIPLTAGFMGKFYVVASGVSSALWLLVGTLVVTSVIGLFYYLRLVAAMFDQVEPEVTAPREHPAGSFAATAVLAVLALLLLVLGVYPAPFIRLIAATVAF